MDEARHWLASRLVQEYDKVVLLKSRECRRRDGVFFVGDAYGFGI